MTINKIFEATKEESLDRGQQVDLALHRTDGAKESYIDDTESLGEDESSDAEPITTPRTSRNLKDLKVKHYSKKKAAVRASNSELQDEQKHEARLPGRKAVKANGVVGKRQKGKKNELDPN